MALTDQWYLQYGEEVWRNLTGEALAAMGTTHTEARNAFEAALGWCAISVPYAEGLLLSSLVTQAQAVGLLPLLWPRHSHPLGPVFPDRVALRLDALHGLLHCGAPAAAR